MDWEIKYLDEVEKDLKQIDPSHYSQILNTIEKKLSQNPLEFGKPLKKPLHTFRSLRIGQFRVIYTVKNKQVKVLVIAIGIRRNMEIYKKAFKRLKKK